MSISPSLDICASTENNIISFPVSLEHNLSMESIETKALLDSGAGGVFMDQNLAKKLSLDIKTLDIPVI